LLFISLTRAFSGLDLLSFTQKYIENQQAGSNTDRHVRHVKCWVMPPPKLHIDKIDDKPEPEPVNDIPCNSSKQQSKGTEQAIVASRCPPKEVEH
jgi:hypothetical protein